MKTIAQLAIEMNVSRQYVYDRIKKADISVDTLIGEKRGKKKYLSEDGQRIICQLMTDKLHETCQENGHVNDTATCHHVSSDEKTDPDTFEKRIEMLQQQHDKDVEEIGRLRIQIDELNGQIRLQAATIAAQADTIHLKEQKEQMRLMAPEEKMGFIGKLIHRLRIGK